MRRFLPWAIFAALVLVAGLVVVMAVSLKPASRRDEADSVHAQEGIALMRQHLYHAAIDEFEAAARQTPQALDPWVGLAAVHIRLGNAQKAIEDAAKAVHLANDSPDVQLVLGRAHWLARNLRDAEEAALRVEKLDPDNLLAADLLAHVYFDRNDEAKFHEVFERTQYPNASMQDLAVQLAVRRGEFRRAYELRSSFDRRNLEIQIFRDQLALKREPNRSELLPVLIQNLVSVGRFDDAITMARQIRDTSMLDVELGKAYWLAGRKEDAGQAFQRAAQAKTHRLSAEVALLALTNDRRHWTEAFRSEWIEKDYFVLAKLEDLLKTGSSLDRALVYRYAGLYDSELFNSAAREAQLVLKSEPESFDALMTLGTAYSRLGRVDDATRYMEQAASRYPGKAEVWARLGQFALQKQNYTVAEELMGRAVKLEPANASYLYNYAWMLDQLDRDNEAIPYYQRAIESSPLSFEAMNNLALIESSAGNQDKGLSLLARAVASNPQNEMALLNRGNYYASLKSWDKALSDYEHVREINPANALAFVESARTHIELGRIDIAIDELSTALDLDPGVPEGYSLLSAAYVKQGRKREADAALDESKRLKEVR
jgi:tetratricopeptide (TPR) repeat protein